MKRQVRSRCKILEDGSSSKVLTWLVYLKDHRCDIRLQDPSEKFDAQELLDLFARLNDAERKRA